jgi:hypothetical protein
LSYEMFFICVGFGGLVLLAIFSMLAMAHMQEEDQDRLEIELRRGNSFALPVDREGNPVPICGSVTPNLEIGGPPKSRMFISR